MDGDSRFFLPLCYFFVLLALLSQDNHIKFLLFILSGFALGLFFGKHNHEVWPQRYAYEPKIYEKVYFYWVHLIGGIVGGVSLHLLTNRIHFIDLQLLSNENFALEDFILFMLAILGYSGYLPRTLTFIANKGGFGLRGG